MDNKGGTRQMLQHLVDGGYLTEADAIEVSDLIDAVTEHVHFGEMTWEEGQVLIDQMAREKAEEYRERVFLYA